MKKRKKSKLTPWMLTLVSLLSGFKAFAQITPPHGTVYGPPPLSRNEMILRVFIWLALLVVLLALIIGMAKIIVGLARKVKRKYAEKNSKTWKF